MKILNTNPAKAFFQYLEAQGFFGVIGIARNLKRDDISMSTRRRLLADLEHGLSSTEPLISIEACRLVMCNSPLLAEQIWAGNHIVKIARVIAAPQIVIFTKIGDWRDNLNYVNRNLFEVNSFCLRHQEFDDSKQEIINLKRQAERLNANICAQLYRHIESLGDRPSGKVLPFHAKAS